MLPQSRLDRTGLVPKALQRGFDVILRALPVLKTSDGGLPKEPTPIWVCQKSRNESVIRNLFSRHPTIVWRLKTWLFEGRNLGKKILRKRRNKNKNVFGPRNPPQPPNRDVATICPAVRFFRVWGTHPTTTNPLLSTTRDNSLETQKVKR